MATMPIADDYWSYHELPNLFVEPDALARGGAQLHDAGWTFFQSIGHMRGQHFLVDSTMDLYKAFGSKGASDSDFRECVETLQAISDHLNVIHNAVHNTAEGILHGATLYRHTDEVVRGQFITSRTYTYRPLECAPGMPTTMTGHWHDRLRRLASPCHPTRHDDDATHPVGEAGPMRHAAESLTYAANALDELHLHLCQVCNEMYSQWKGMAATAACTYTWELHRAIASLSDICRQAHEKFWRLGEQIDEANPSALGPIGEMVVGGILVVCAVGAVVATGGVAAALIAPTLDLGFAGVMAAATVTTLTANVGLGLMESGIVHLQSGDDTSLRDLGTDLTSSAIGSVLPGNANLYEFPVLDQVSNGFTDWALDHLGVDKNQPFQPPLFDIPQPVFSRGTELDSVNVTMVP